MSTFFDASKSGAHPASAAQAQDAVRNNAAHIQNVRILSSTQSFKTATTGIA
jgi:hypothetical protein